jgi:type I restriction enzyme S subunit
VGVLKTSCVFTGVFRAEEHKAVVPSERNRVAEPVKRDTVLVSRMNTPDLVGASAYVADDHARLFLPDRLWQVRAGPGAIPRWLGFVIGSPAMRIKLGSIASGTSNSMKNISQESFLDLPLSIPPLDEQRRIVAVLETWDRAIADTERLIAAKRRRKRSLLQTLFRNQPRRPFLEAAEVWFSGVDKKSREGEAAVRLCNYMDVFHNARITGDLEFMQATAKRSQIAANTLRAGDVVFTKDSETMEEIAEPALVADDIDGLVCGYHLAIARPREGVAHGPFIAQAMRHSEMRWQFSRLANGVVRFGLTLDAIEQAEIFLPSLPVQKRIAAVLDAEDDALDGLTKQLDVFRNQKRGLMQKLLTGEWRLDARYDPDTAALTLAAGVAR